MSCGQGSQRPTTLRLAMSSSSRSVCSKGVKKRQDSGIGARTQAGAPPSTLSFLRSQYQAIQMQTS